MASVENLEKKLEQLIIKNNKSFAIALTGDWGIGKTHFWNKFLKENNSKLNGQKYAYVSLFGVESLNDLKLSIAIETHELNSKDKSILHKDILKPTKKLASTLTGGNSTGGSDLKIGINIGNQLITSMILKHLGLTHYPNKT